jgi:GNAT superfamily N-acetyltransferase
VVGQIMHTREWSDWRNGDIWWLQSVYVHADYRGQGVFRALFEHLQALARRSPDVVGLRLYVEQENDAARQVYVRLGLRPGGYDVLEDLWRDVAALD